MPSLKERMRPVLQSATKIILPASSTRIAPTQVATCAEWVARTRARSGTAYHHVHAGRMVDEAPPRYPQPPLHPVFSEHLSWIQPEAFVVAIPNGRVWGRRGAVLTDDGFLLGDVSREFGAYKGIADERHSVFKQILLAPPTRLPGTVAVIAAPGSRNYHHWLFDILPRVHLLRASGLAQPLDRLIIDHEGLPFQRESLAAIGIPESQLVLPRDQWNTHFQADSVVVPSLPSQLCTVSDWVVPFLRETFLGGYVPERKRRLYVSRRKAASRREANREEIAAFLSRLGFEEYFAEDHAIAEAARDFASAEWVVGMHGSGLSNLVFASPATKVVEFLPRQHLDPYYWMLSNRTGCDYAYLFAEGEAGDAGRDLVSKKIDLDVEISVPRLAAVMKLLEEKM